MAIMEFVGAHPRIRIGFVEDDPSAAAAAALTGYDLYRFEEKHLGDPGALATTCAVVFRQREDKPGLLFVQLEKYAAKLLWHDCRVFLQTVPALPGGNGANFRRMALNALRTLKLPPSGLSDEDASHFVDWLGDAGAVRLTPSVHMLNRPGHLDEVATLVHNNPPGPPPQYELAINAVDVDGETQALTLEQEMLVRRAFSNCASLQLVGVKNGLSGVLAFRAFSHLKQGAVGSKWPHLYFVKIGERAKISNEFIAYQANALEHIPFHLGPRLRLDRCALGSECGIIVSDYVGESEPLRDCAKHGRAVPVIANLFNTTLRAWRESAIPETTTLQSYLDSGFSLPIPPHRAPLIRAYGANLSLGQLKELFVKVPSSPVLVGVVHGDLHATNVMVRGGDAIVIDFEKVGMRAPLLRDMASLEGGLFVDGFIGDRRSGEDLLKSLECLYQPSAFDGSIPHCHPTDGSAWYFDCVRQIRMQARQIELAPRQYALALASILARKSCNPEDFRDVKAGATQPSCPLTREDVRALAYLLAQRVLEAIQT